MTTTIYNMACHYCLQPYDYRIIEGNIDATVEGIKPDVDKFDMVTIEGICSPCKIQEHQKYSLEEVVE